MCSLLIITLHRFDPIWVCVLIISLLLYCTNWNASSSRIRRVDLLSGSNIFGSTSQQPTGGGLFGSNAFGQQNKPTGFGFGATASQSSLFAQAQPTAQQTASPFQPSTSNTLFGGGAGFGATQQTGTVIKFQPLTSTDTMQKSGVATTINTKHHCITCMKEYEGKSLEELRWEDYQANRKGKELNL